MKRINRARNENDNNRSATEEELSAALGDAVLGGEGDVQDSSIDFVPEDTEEPSPKKKKYSYFDEVDDPKKMICHIFGIFGQDQEV